jgi:hypothetical protein
MAIDTARFFEQLKQEEIELLDQISMASQHLVEMERLVKEVKTRTPEVLGKSKIIGATQTVITGKAGELGAHLIEFNHAAKKIHNLGIVFVNQISKKRQ